MEQTKNEHREHVVVAVAWPYVNGNLHIGHVAGYLLPADITARFFRAIGKKVLMVSGSDCFGTPITVEADKERTTPEKIVEKYHARNLELFKNLGLTYDLYTKTDTPNHRHITQEFLLAFYKKGLLAVDTQLQYYSQEEKKFLPDRYVEGTCPHCGFTNARSDQCDNCGKLLDQNLVDPRSKITKEKVTLKKTQHLFILWNKLEKDIQRYVAKAQNWRPWVLAETKRWLSGGLKPRAVTRDIDWGVELPKELAAILPESADKRIYVWFDAVIGYYSASVEWSARSGKDMAPYWKAPAKHYYFMGKDNLVFHTVFWPGQLMVFDPKLKLPDMPSINQYLTLGQEKFSKSRGIIVDTAEFIKSYGSDSLRFYLTSVMPENADSQFTWEDFYLKNNTLLVDQIGNYFNRALVIYKDLPSPTAKVSLPVLNALKTAFSRSEDNLKASQFKAYLEEVLTLTRFANNHFNESAPWKLRSSNPGEFRQKSGDFIGLAFGIGLLLYPVTPFAFDQLRQILSVTGEIVWPKKDTLPEFFVSHLKKIKITNPYPLYKKFETAS